MFAPRNHDPTTPWLLRAHFATRAHFAMEAVWMFGHVHCALTFGIGIRGQNGAVYVAPRHEVHPDVLQEVGLGGSLAKVRVAFQADERPGAWEQEGFNRAKMVSWF